MKNKKILAFILAAVMSIGFLSFAQSDISVIVNDQQVVFDTSPQIINDRVMVPLRAICEALACKVDWKEESQTIVIIDGKRRNVLTIGSQSAYVYTSTSDYKKIMLDSPPVIIDNRTLVPVRYIAESQGAQVNWIESENKVEITKEVQRISLQIGAKEVYTGQKLQDLKQIFGEPDRVDNGMYGVQWYVYNREYSNFLMAAVSHGIVCGYYTNAAGFTVNGTIRADAAYEGEMENIHLYRDKQNENKVHAVLVMLENYKQEVNTTSEEFLKIQSLEVFDATNAFRVKNGIAPLIWEEYASKAAQLHALDMANQNYFAHESLDGRRPIDRYMAIHTVSWNTCGENIAAGRTYGVDNFDAWLNSPGHRSNMLNPSYKYLGVGAAYRENSDYRYYYGQTFITY